MDVTCRRTYLADLMTVDLSVAEILESIKTNGTAQMFGYLVTVRHILASLQRGCFREIRRRSSRSG